MKFWIVTILKFIAKGLLHLLAIFYLFYLFDPDKAKDPYSFEENRERYR